MKGFKFKRMTIVLPKNVKKNYSCLGGIAGVISLMHQYCCEEIVHTKSFQNIKTFFFWMKENKRPQSKKRKQLLLKQHKGNHSIQTITWQVSHIISKKLYSILGYLKGTKFKKNIKMKHSFCPEAIRHRVQKKPEHNEK